MKFIKFESTHRWRSRTPFIWVNLDNIESVSEYPKFYLLRCIGDTGLIRIEKTRHNRDILQEVGVTVYE